MNSKLIRKLFFAIIYVYAYYNFFAEFILPGLIGTRSILFLALDAIFLMLGLVTIKSFTDKIYFSLFITLTIASQLYNQLNDPILYLNGFRDFIPVFCAPFIIKYLLDKQGETIIIKFNRFLKLFLLIQIPVAILQYKQYGPGDMVGGTLGEGASGTITLLIYIATFYLFKYENISLSLKDLKKLIFIFACWIPTFINETKVSFLLLPLFFIFQLQLNRDQIIKSIALILVLLPLMFFTLQQIYSTNDRYNKVTFDQKYLTNYLFGQERGAEYKDLPRFLRLELGLKALSEEKYSLYLGKGLGQFKGGTTLDKTEFALRHSDIMSGSIIYIFFVLIQLGILGFILLFTYIFAYFFTSFTYDKSTMIFYFIITIIAINYGTALRNAIFAIILYFIILSPKISIHILRDKN